MRAHRPSRAKPGNATSRGSAGGRARADRQREAPAPRRLPVVPSGWASLFRPTELGEEDRRRDCLHYDRCLRAYRGKEGASCPDDCARHEDPTQGPRATEYASPNPAAWGAT